MNSETSKYKDVVKLIIIITILMSVFTLFHVLYRKTHIANNFNKINIAKNVQKEDINYDYLKNDIDDIVEKIKRSESLSFNENVYKIDFYEKANNIYMQKINEISNIIQDRLIDDEAEAKLIYNIDKFYSDLKNDEEQQKRIYESTILASLNVNKERCEKLKEKCYDLIDEYRIILDK